jgi:glycosyltransferase involved in cell wall biosynthesis
MISIVVSTHNRSSRLSNCIKSVLNQTYPDWELVIVDDASTDDTEKVVKSFDDPRIVYVKRKKNWGNDTRPKNDGVLASKGEYLAFLDDDNTFRLDHLSVLLSALEKNPHVDMVYGDRWLVDETKRIPNQVGVYNDYSPALLMQRNYIDTSDVLMKRQAIFDIGGWDERYKKYVDWNLWVRLCKYGKTFKRIPLLITDYHLHAQMKSVTVKDRNPDGSPSTPLGSAPVFRPEWDPYEVQIELPYLGKEPREPKVAVFTLTYNRLNYTKSSFESLRKTSGWPFDHFIVDNGSTDGTPKWLDGYKTKHGSTVKLILNPDNKGISIASNQAINEIKKGDYDIMVKFDNDCMCITEGWLDAMIKIWKANHRLALSCYVQGLKDNPGGAPREEFATLCGEPIGMTRHLGGILHFVDARAYNEFRWPEDEFLHGVQDMEMSQWLNYHGFSMGYLENYFVSHGPTGTEGQKKDYPEYFAKRVTEKTVRYESHGRTTG